MALDPQYAAAPKIGVATINAANANRDGTGTISGAILTGAAAGGSSPGGTRVRAIHVRAVGTTTAGMVRLFLHDGTTAHLLREIPVSAITPGANTEAFSAHLTEAVTPDLLPLTLPPNWSLRASTNNAESFRVTVEGADL